MSTALNSVLRGATALLLALVLAIPGLAQAPATAQGESGYKLSVTSDLVLVNVVARDKSGRLVTDLKSSDFTVLEDGKPQQIRSFDIESPDTAPAPQSPNMTPQLTVGGSATPRAPQAAPVDVHDRRLIVIVFDMTSMQPEEVRRAADAALQYIERSMSPADLVAVATLGDSLQVLQDFTSDQAQIKRVLDQLNGSEEQGFEATSSTEQAETGASYTPDDAEYNLFNIDRRLQALQSLSQSLTGIQQKKSVIYFSSGMERTGLENQSQLRATVNAAVRANVSLYSVDVRGLEALPPTGNAQQGSLRGTAAYSGQAVQAELDSNFDSQETLVTLSNDTGGHALLDSNDLGVVFTRVHQDTSSYYVLGYRSSNRTLDGRYRHITVRVARKDVKLEFRSGYYAGRDFTHFTREDKEDQMQDVLTSDLPVTDLPVYASAEYFRDRSNDYFVPVSIAVPLSVVPRSKHPEKDRLDILGVVREATSKIPVGTVRDTIKLPAAAEGGATHRNIQYETHFTLAPGTYDLKVVVRENMTGKLGTFEANFNVVDMRKTPLKISSIVLATQTRPAKGDSPLVVGKTEYVPNMSHVFSGQQSVTVLYEVYDPRTASGSGSKAENGPRVLTYAQFFRGATRVFQTPVLDMTVFTHADRHAMLAQLQLPASQLTAGWYTCQVTAIDDVAGTLGFVRFPIRVVGSVPKSATGGAAP